MCLIIKWMVNLMKELKQEMVWNFENVLSEEEQLERFKKFNEIVVDIAADYYINEKKKKHVKQQENT
jgi:hypothetical protein